MTKCNIIILEDNKAHRENLVNGLKKEYEYGVKGFRDLTTFAAACEDKTIMDGMETDLPPLVILDIMMAEKLGENELCAPRCMNDNPSAEELKKSVDDELGLKIAVKIRKGVFGESFKDVPILFLTARQNDDFVTQLNEIPSSFFLDKPAWLDQVHEAIENLLAEPVKANDRQ